MIKSSILRKREQTVNRYTQALEQLKQSVDDELKHVAINGKTRYQFDSILAKVNHAGSQLDLIDEIIADNPDIFEN
jgi:hypothetical protein